jgi:DNA repair protein RecN (Recombination protein N)
MLEELRIHNFAIIDRLELTFAAGLNVITGETGAGKSIIIDAVELLLGGKADPSFVRTGADKSIIEGVFVLNPVTQAMLTPILEREELYDPSQPDALTLSREVRVNGRSTARVNGVTVNIDVLMEIGDVLVDVHGQSAHMSLFKPKAHIDLLDRFAGLIDARLAYTEVFNKLLETRREMQSLMSDEAALQRRADLLRHEVEEIDAAALVPGEEDTLKSELTRLANSEQLAKLTGEAVVLLHGDDGIDQMAAVDQLMQVSVLLHRLSGIDAEMKAAYDLAEIICAQAEELTHSVRRYNETVEYNPERLEELEERLELLSKLKRRYGGTIESVIAYADRARAELDGIEHSEERLTELRKRESKLLKQIGDQATKMSRARASAGQKLAAGIVSELADLRMERAVFEVGIAQYDDPEGCYVGEARLAFDATGIDHVEFMMSANPGEPLRPLAKVASGGEAARIMLALKRVLTQADQTPTLIFDEIDQGIGGRVGTVVGEKLWGLTGEHQVFVVTHLAQLAGYADQHYRVRKLVESARTHTEVAPLIEDQQRIDELAAMLGTYGDAGKQSARELLIEALEYKQKAVGPSQPPPAQKSFF